MIESTINAQKLLSEFVFMVLQNCQKMNLFQSKYLILNQKLAVQLEKNKNIKLKDSKNSQQRNQQFRKIQEKDEQKKEQEDNKKSAFDFYLQDQREIIRQAYPQMSESRLIGLLAQNFKKLSPMQMMPYVKKIALNKRSKKSKSILQEQDEYNNQVFDQNQIQDLDHYINQSIQKWNASLASKAFLDSTDDIKQYRRGQSYRENRITKEKHKNEDVQRKNRQISYQRDDMNKKGNEYSDFRQQNILGIHHILQNRLSSRGDKQKQISQFHSLKNLFKKLQNKET